DRGAYALTALLKVHDVVYVQTGQLTLYQGLQLRIDQERAIGSCRRCEPVRHIDALRRQRAAHLTQRRVLAANHGDVREIEVVEPADPVTMRHVSLPGPGACTAIPARVMRRCA